MPAQITEKGRSNASDETAFHKKSMQHRKKIILQAYVWVVRPPILVNESLLTNTERAPGNRVAKYRARPQAARRYAA